MLTRIFSAVVLVCLLVVPVTAQTVRFDTNVGHFDLVLNPTNNPNLQGHVDNILTYVEDGAYDLTVINRADEGFVLQLGGFDLAGGLSLPTTFSAFPGVTPNDPVIVDADNDGAVDFDVSDLLNTRGTVSLALSTSANTGTSSFFINLIDNPGLDAAALRFVPFATVVDFSTIDLIFSLNQTDFADGTLAGDDVPMLPDNTAVFLERVFVLDEEIAAASALALPFTDSVDIEDELASTIGSDALALSASSTPAVTAIAVPEPPALVLAIGAIMAIYILKPSRN